MSTENRMANIIPGAIIILGWLIWVYHLGGLFFYRAYLLGLDSGDNGNGQGAVVKLVMLILPAGLCLLLRWWTIPRIKSLWVMLLTLILGVMIGRAISLYGIILFSEWRAAFFWISVLMVAQFAPTYLMRKG